MQGRKGLVKPDQFDTHRLEQMKKLNVYVYGEIILTSIGEHGSIDKSKTFKNIVSESNPNTRISGQQRLAKGDSTYFCSTFCAMLNQIKLFGAK